MRYALNSRTMPGQPALRSAAVLERIETELDWLGLDTSVTETSVEFVRPTSYIVSAPGFWGFIRRGRITFCTDDQGRHHLDAVVTMSWPALIISVLGLGIPLYFVWAEIRVLLDTLRDRYLGALAPERRRLLRPPN
jgi:hypothetical protein